MRTQLMRNMPFNPKRRRKRKKGGSNKILDRMTAHRIHAKKSLLLWNYRTICLGYMSTQLYSLHLKFIACFVVDCIIRKIGMVQNHLAWRHAKCTPPHSITPEIKSADVC